jgi:hypothetical protein
MDCLPVLGKDISVAIDRLSAEKRMVLSLCALKPSSKALDRARSIMAESHYIDYETILRLAALNGISSLLYVNLRELGSVPEDIMRKLRNAYLHTVGRNTAMKREMLKVLGLLGENATDAIVVKGVFASETVFGDPGLYPSVDIDILVRPSDLDEALRVLRKDGYETEGGVISADFHVALTRDGYMVEAHWNLIKKYIFIDPRFWWEETREFEYEGMRMASLSHERYLMYLVSHLFGHGFSCLKFFVLTAETVNKYRSEIDWDKLMGLCVRHRMKRLMVFTLRILNELFGMEVREDILALPCNGYGFLARTVVDAMFNDRKSGPKMLPYVLLLDGPLDILGLLLRRSFPPPNEMRLLYNIRGGPLKVCVYYLFRPFLMLHQNLGRKSG